MSNRVKLEVDPSILERNLNFLGNDEGIENFSLYPNSLPDDEIPWKYAIPKPGFVAKVRTLEGDKVFLNVCYCSDIPSPKDISEEELLRVLDSEEPYFTVPMSVGELHVESDKSGNLASAYDIAISKEFFDKIEGSSLFKTFFTSLIMESVEDKYNIKLDRDTEVVVLKNRKCFGTLQLHRIQQRPVRTPPQRLIQELSDINKASKSNVTAGQTNKKPLIEELPDSPSKIVQKNPNENWLKKIKLVKIPKKDPPELMIAYIKIAALSGAELELDIGEDRILINSPRRKEKFDFFLPYNIDRDRVSAKYLVNRQILRIEMPTKEVST